MQPAIDPRHHAPSTRRLLVAAACGTGLELALGALTALVETAPGEPFVLRLLRGLAEHPLRTGTAFGLAFWAILPSPIGTPSPTTSAALRADSVSPTR